MIRDNWPYVVVWLGLTMVLWTVVNAIQKVVGQSDQKQGAVDITPGYRVLEANGVIYHIWTSPTGGVAVVNITKDKAEIEALSVSR